jgi:hypothetical protein
MNGSLLLVICFVFAFHVAVSSFRSSSSSQCALLLVKAFSYPSSVRLAHHPRLSPRRRPHPAAARGPTRPLPSRPEPEVAAAEPLESPGREERERQRRRNRIRTPQHIPQTQTIPESFGSFVKYCVRQSKTAFVFSTSSKRRTRWWRFGRRKIVEQTKDEDEPPLPPILRPTDEEEDDFYLDTAATTTSGRGFLATVRAWNRQRQALVELANYKKFIVLPSFTALTIGALLVSVIPHYEAQCIQLVATLHPVPADIIKSIGGLLITSTLAAFFTGLRGSLFWMAGSRANYQIRVKLHENLLYQEAAFFDDHETGSLLSRLNSDVNKIGQVISYHVNVVCRQLAQFIFGSIYLIRISPRLSLFAGLGIVLVAICSAIYGKFNRDCAMTVQDTFANATSVAETSFRLSETIRLLNGRRSQSKSYETAQRSALQVEEIQAWGYGTHKVVSDTLQAVLHGALLFLCWSYGRTTGLPADRLTTFLFYTHFVLESSNEVGDQWAKIQGYAVHRPCKIITKRDKRIMTMMMM